MLTNNLIYVSTRLDKNQFQLKNYCIIKILRKIISPHVSTFLSLILGIQFPRLVIRSRPSNGEQKGEEEVFVTKRER